MRKTFRKFRTSRWWSNVQALRCDADALKKLDQLTPAKKTQQWIPVSDHLPEKNGEYLVTVRKDSRFAFNGEATVYEDTFYSLCQWDDCGEDVIAWMEMPEPYKEEEQ